MFVAMVQDVPVSFVSIVCEDPISIEPIVVGLVCTLRNERLGMHDEECKPKNEILGMHVEECTPRNEILGMHANEFF